MIGVSTSGRFAYSVGRLAYPIVRGAFKNRGKSLSFGERGREPRPNIVRGEFKYLCDYFCRLKKKFFNNDPGFKDLSMGMSGDYQLAISQGSNMVRVGSSIFGTRN